ncbi:VolA/Pla-1 family phospholipase [Bowmanella sp. JS7-9]|uniref:VolA/Pla-1 family phospholipase n=1 Tax=Pseudobowmanella zhangzhouensis TaxID=1537679 RepID=A0ABW1XLN4_9ALTE|nr:VolA/Pla-1 family phospholipase [Bowmanella sp. JS7-9]TBX27584.1 hypothetical protein TK45_00115 [Bowmanella sp. JS7-9]
MKKLILSSTIAAVLGLTGCGGGETLADKQKEASASEAVPFTRVVFDPSNSDLNIPNDLLVIPKGNLFDFTLNILADEVVDPADPQYALGALDGWSTQHPFSMRFTVAAGVEIDAVTAAAPGSIRIYEAEQVLESDEAICQAIAAEVQAPGLPCLLHDELQFGVDFVTQKSSANTMSIVPLKPLKPGQGYVIVVTTDLKDSLGRDVVGSTTWELVKQDPTAYPLGSDAQKQLQQIVDFFVTLLDGKGLSRDDVSYAAYFTTQSAGTVLSTVKSLNVAPYAQAFGQAYAATGSPTQAYLAAREYLPEVAVTDYVVPDVFTAFAAQGIITTEQIQGLAAIGITGCNAAQFQAAFGTGNAQVIAAASGVMPHCAAQMRAGSINLPYYLSKENPLGDWWRSACTSGAQLQAMGAEAVGGLIAAGAVGANNNLCQLASDGQLFDLNLAAVGIDDPRNLTRFAPIPAATTVDNIPVQITVPDTAFLSLYNQAPTTMPATGWPVVILQHGITSKKEDMLAITGALSLAGFATIAIDHPLHGARGVVATDTNGVEREINASTMSATDYMNLASLLTTRDNVRQSISDILGLRLGIHNVDDGSTGGTMLDANNVYFVGHSLGAITGTSAVALANTTMGETLGVFDGLYAMKATTLAMPGGSVAAFLFDSGAFGNLVKGSLVAAQSADFRAALGAYMQANGIANQEQAISVFFPLFFNSLSAAEQAEISAVFQSFSFAAQTVTDAGDPNNYAGMLAATETPVHLIEVVGGNDDNDGGTWKSDQVIPNQGSIPLAGTEPLAALIGLSSVSTTTPGSGIVRFLEGTHSSILDPGPSLAATAEMQKQTAGFMQSTNAGQATIVVTDTTVVKQ